MKNQMQNIIKYLVENKKKVLAISFLIFIIIITIILISVLAGQNKSNKQQQMVITPKYNNTLIPITTKQSNVIK